MNKITELNKSTLTEVRNRLNKELTKVGDELGIKFKFGNIVYNDDNIFHCKLEGALEVSANGRSVNDELDKLCLPLGTKIKIKNDTYEVSGYSPNKPKFCIQLRGLHGAKDGNCSLECAKNFIVK